MFEAVYLVKIYGLYLYKKINRPYNETASPAGKMHFAKKMYFLLPLPGLFANILFNKSAKTASRNCLFPHSLPLPFPLPLSPFLSLSLSSLPLSLFLLLPLSTAIIRHCQIRQLCLSPLRILDPVTLHNFFVPSPPKKNYNESEVDS